jgi:hypothetical protein
LRWYISYRGATKISGAETIHRNGPALAQEPPATTPAPETEQAPAAKTDTATETKKPEPAAHPHTVHHTQVGRYVWPWDWAWYQLRRELRYLQHHRA